MSCLKHTQPREAIIYQTWRICCFRALYYNRTNNWKLEAIVKIIPRIVTLAPAVTGWPERCDFVATLQL